METSRKYTKRVSIEEFVAAWLKYASLAEVAAAVNSTPKGVTQRAVALRKAGIRLPKKRTRIAGAVDVEAINRKFNL